MAENENAEPAPQEENAEEAVEETVEELKEESTEEPVKQAAEEPEEPKDQPKSESYWPEDWAEKAAEHYSAGDKKAYERELKRLQRIKDPAALYGMYREAESRLTSGGLLKVPDENASEEEIAAYRKAIGVPEKPEDYLDGLELENGAKIGEADKPVVDAFAQVMHEAGATKETMSKILNWYYQNEDNQLAALDERDEKDHQESMAELKEELGPSFKRKTNAIAGLFAQAPGGTDGDNEGALVNRLMQGRMADGKLIGNDPDMIRFLVGLASEVNPTAMVVDDGDHSGQSIASEIAALEKRMREDRRGYFKDEKAQARYRELVDVQQRMQARA